VRIGAGAGCWMIEEYPFPEVWWLWDGWRVWVDPAGKAMWAVTVTEGTRRRWEKRVGAETSLGAMSEGLDWVTSHNKCA